MSDKCKWKYINTEDFYMAKTEYIYKTSCDHRAHLLEDFPDDDFKYCPYCGKEIEEVKQ